MEKIDSEDYKKIKLISQGTYGCIFKKGLTCDGMVDETNTISKIQEKNETSENEITMGKKIMTIPNYQDHFDSLIVNFANKEKRSSKEKQQNGDAQGKKKNWTTLVDAIKTAQPGDFNYWKNIYYIADVA